MSSYIDPNTLQPPRFGELYSDRSITITGKARWTGGFVTTQGLAAVLSPSGGGAPSVCSLPDQSFALPSDGYSVWVKVIRTAGSHTLTPVIYNDTSMPKPTPDDIPLFLRHGGEVYCYGSGLQLTPYMRAIGGTNLIADYEYVVGSDPRATHATIQSAIQTAITDGADGARILVLSGTYDPGVGTSGYGYHLNNISLTIEGEGWSSVISNSQSLTTAFGISSDSSSSTGKQGNGSRILNLRLEGFAQPVKFDGGVSFGIRNCVVDLWQGAHTIYTSPNISGGGTSENNDVTVRVYANTGLTPNDQVRHYLLGSSSLLFEDALSTFNNEVTFDDLVKMSLLLAGPTVVALDTGTITPAAKTAGKAGYVIYTDDNRYLRSMPFAEDGDNDLNTTASQQRSLVLRDQNGKITVDKVRFQGLLEDTSTSVDFLVKVPFFDGGETASIKYSTTTAFTNTIARRDGSGLLHANSLRLAGVTTASDTEVLTIDVSGYVHKRTGAFNTDYFFNYGSLSSPPVNSLGFKWADPDADWLVPWVNNLSLDNPSYGVRAGNFKATSRYKGSHGPNPSDEGVALQADSSNQLTFNWICGSGPSDSQNCLFASYNGGPRRITSTGNFDISCYCSGSCLGIFAPVDFYEYGCQLQFTIDDSLCFGIVQWNGGDITLEDCTWP